MFSRASLVAQLVKNLPATRETWVWSLGQEDPLKKEMATHSSTPAWKIPWTAEPGRLQSMRLQRVGHEWVTSLHFTFGGLRQCKLAVLPFWRSEAKKGFSRRKSRWQQDCIVLQARGRRPLPSMAAGASRHPSLSFSIFKVNSNLSLLSTHLWLF